MATTDYIESDSFDSENIDPTVLGDEDYVDIENDNYDGDDIMPIDYDYSDDFDNATDD